MQDVFVATDKISFLKECLLRYNGSTGYLVLYFALLIYILVCGSKKEKLIFIPMSILTVLTVYNPFFPLLLNIVTEIDSEYYRFFWMTPVVILVPYVFTKIILAMLDGRIKHKYLVSVVLVMIVVSSSKCVLGSGMSLPENIYKVPNEVIEISEIIHNDSQFEYPKAFLEFENNMQMRQYDPAMLLTIDREDYLKAVSGPIPQELVDSDEFPQFRILAALYRYQECDISSVVEGFEMTDTEYVVLTTGSHMIPVLIDAGLVEIGKTKTYTVLKYNQREMTPFELVDYSECYENGW